MAVGPNAIVKAMASVNLPAPWPFIRVASLHFFDTARRRLLPAAIVSSIDFSGFRDYSNHRGVVAVRACVAKRGAS
jgi:hypothetical protein